MKNNLKSYTMFVRSDATSHQIADTIRNLIASYETPLDETKDGDLVIAIGGDGTFIDAVTSTNFNKQKIYAGVNTGTLGFLQNISPDEFFSFINDLSKEREIRTRKVFVPSISVVLNNGETLEYQAVNEVVIVGAHSSKISFTEYNCIFFIPFCKFFH